MKQLREDIITIFTPVYNRAHLLGRLFDSLKRQTCPNFEWIALDDGSTDNSLATLHELRTGGGALFPITVMHTENGGKQRAANKAVREANGEYFMMLDSDDYLLPDAVENIHAWIKEIKNEPDYKYFAGVSGLRVHKDGSCIGGSGTGEKYIDASNLERRKYNLGGDKAEVYKTSIMKTFPFVEFEGEIDLMEGHIWSLIAVAGYKLRWYPVGLIVCEYLPDGITRNYEAVRLRNFDGHTYNLRLQLRLYDMSFKQRAEIISHYALLAQKKGLSMQEAARRLGVSYFMMRCSLLAYKLYQPIKKFIKHRRN